MLVARITSAVGAFSRSSSKPNAKPGELQTSPQGSPEFTKDCSPRKLCGATDGGSPCPLYARLPWNAGASRGERMSYRRALIKRSASAAYGLKFSGTSDWNLSNGDVCGSLLSKSRRRAEDSK